MSEAMASGEPEAPTYAIPPRQVVAVEHPCIIKNIDRGIHMLGGSAAIKHILAPGPAKPLGLNMQPSNPDSRPILSFSNPANNVLLRIKVPKRIGKRKRGSDGPFVALTAADDDGRPRSAGYLVQSLRDNAAASPQQVEVEAVGAIKQTHVWREMPDFVYSTQGADFVSNVRSHLLPRDLQSIKSFQMERRHGPRGNEAVPPPVLSTVSLPLQASYRQDVSSRPWPLSGEHPGGGSSSSSEAVAINNVKTTKTTKTNSTPSSTNPSVSLRTSMASVTTFVDGCPMGPSPLLPPLSLQSRGIRELYPLLADLFKQRPLWTRRALLSQLPADATHDRLRFVLPYVAFLIRAGPWRYCLCRFGIDPTSSPDFRIYQTVRIKTSGSGSSRNNNNSSSNNEPDQAETTEATESAGPSSMLFTGTHPHPRDGSIWQLCDIADPQLTPLVNLPLHSLPASCDTKCFGWYPNGALSKIRTVMKAKLDAYTTRLAKQEQDQQPPPQPPIDPAVFDRFLALLPNQLDHFDPSAAEMGDPNFGYLPPPMTPLELELAATYRGIAREEMNKELRRGGGAGAGGRAAAAAPAPAPAVGADRDESDGDDNDDDDDVGEEEDDDDDNVNSNINVDDSGDDDNDDDDDDSADSTDSEDDEGDDGDDGDEDEEVVPSAD